MQIESPERLSNQPATVKLDDIDPKRPLNQTASLLELLLTSLSNHMKLKSKQAAALLANNNKYLAHMLVAGQKNQFNTVVNWLMDLHANAKQVRIIATRDRVLPRADNRGDTHFHASHSTRPDLEELRRCNVDTQVIQ
jgi:hypothetical protein